MGKVAVTAAVIGAAAMCAVVALLVRHQLRNSSQSSRAAAILKEFEEKRGTPESKLKQVADAMPVEMHAGLVSEGRSKLKMLISYVDNLPAGSPGIVDGILRFYSYPEIGCAFSCNILKDKCPSLFKPEQLEADALQNSFDRKPSLMSSKIPATLLNSLFQKDAGSCSGLLRFSQLNLLILSPHDTGEAGLRMTKFA
nr:PREDICTED: uncharacterized protein LOC108212393 [Daucus carota subsp. sativus]